MPNRIENSLKNVNKFANKSGMENSLKNDNMSAIKREKEIFTNDKITKVSGVCVLQPKNKLEITFSENEFSEMEQNLFLLPNFQDDRQLQKQRFKLNWSKKFHIKMIKKIYTFMSLIYNR